MPTKLNHGTELDIDDDLQAEIMQWDAASDEDLMKIETSLEIAT